MNTHANENASARLEGLARELLRALLRHPRTVVVVDERGRLRLAYASEPATAAGPGAGPLPT